MTRNLAILFLLSLCSVSARAQLPFKYDNTVYKAVYLNDAFKLMESSPGYLLLDVRSPGEYADTSVYTSLNIGRFRGAVNINIDSIPAHMEELKKYMDKPVFIYCSHSQRSRRVSKLLAEKGFQKVYNINGGMSVVNESDNKSFTYKNKVLLTSTYYKNIASADAIRLLTKTPDLAIIDIRTEKEFNSQDSVLQNNIGRLKNAVNIPQNVFATKLDSFNIPNSKTVLLYDLYGHNSMDVVDVLKAKGFTRIYNLFEGLYSFISDNGLTENLRHQLLVNAPPYHLLDTKASIDLLKSQPGLVILDARSADEFENTSKTPYLNLGRIKNAVHVSSLESLEKIVSEKDKTTTFLVYGSNTGLGYRVSMDLIKRGYKEVNFLNQGLYQFVWSTANVENCKEGREFLTNHEGLY